MFDWWVHPCSIAMIVMRPNHSIQRMGASRSDHLQFLRQRRLAPTADAGRWPLGLYLRNQGGVASV